MTTKEKLKRAQQHLELWMEAEEAIASSQSYILGKRSLTRANLAEVLKMIEYYEKKIAEYENLLKRGGRNRIRHAIPRDW